MNYASVLDCDVVNGKYVGVSVFCQGCPEPHCSGCFNSSAWEFNGGRIFGEKEENNLFSLIDKPYIKRISILGGEPLCDQNINTITKLVKDCKEKFPDKKIWLWTGYNFPDYKNMEFAKYIDYVVDGKFIEKEKDLSIAFRGSKNQTIWEKTLDGSWVNSTNKYDLC